MACYGCNMSLVLLMFIAAAPPLSPAEKLLTVESVRAHVRFLASDELEGRQPSTRGDRLAQTYIATEFEGLGLKPGDASGGFLQTFDVVSIDGTTPSLTFVARGAKGTLTLKQSEDFIAVSAHQQKLSKLQDAELVFLGYGIVAPEYQWDDFKGVDLRGKVIVVMNNDPEDDPALFAGKARLYYGRWDYKYEQAARVGAAGCIIIHTTPSAGYSWQVVQTSWAGENFDLPAAGPSTAQVKAWVTEQAAKRLMTLAGKDLDVLRAAAQKRDFRPVPLGITVNATIENTVATKTTANVLAVLPGSDPVLKNEYVVITAHHDHLGRKAETKKGEDGIYNGAVDNASGVAALLTVARAMAAMPKAPKRTTLFAAVAAEEQGLLGSQYLVEHPPVPVSKMAADINVDGLNIWGKTRDVSVIGLGKSSIDAVITELARAQNRVVVGDATADRGHFYRSDQFNFAKAGVPAAYFSSGESFIGRPEGWGRAEREKWENVNYHQPSDELTPTWDLSGALEDIQLFFRLAVTLGNAPGMPTWKNGDEFEAIRLKSLK